MSVRTGTTHWLAPVCEVCGGEGPQVVGKGSERYLVRKWNRMRSQWWPGIRPIVRGRWRCGYDGRACPR